MLNLEQNFKNFFGTAALPALDEIFFDHYEMMEDPRPKIFNMESTDRELVQKAGLSSYGLFSITGESELAPKDSASQTFKQNYSVIKYSKSIGISQEMIDDDRYDMISKMVKGLARAAKETQLVTALNLINNASGTTTSWDGVSLLSASHPTQVGNQSNSLGATDLSYTALATGEQLFRKFKDDRGKRLLIRPRILLVAEDNRQNALELVQSPYKAGTANNNINALGADGGLTVVSSPYLTSATDWFLLSDPMDHGLRIIDRQSVTTKTHEDTLASTLYYVSNYRQAVGVDEWRGIAGSISAP
jgi:hypothetical protein